jgi:hypothetical protein
MKYVVQMAQNPMCNICQQSIDFLLQNIPIQFPTSLLPDETPREPLNKCLSRHEIINQKPLNIFS